MIPTAAWGQDLADALTKQHTRTGAHTGITTDTITVTSGSTLPAGDIATADLATASVTADKLATGAQTASVATAETTASTSYVQLATTTDQVTVTIGANGLALLSIFAGAFNSGANLSLISYAISGASTVAASDTNIMGLTSVSTETNTGGTKLITGLTAGSTTFKIMYRVSAGTGTFERRSISVVPL